MCHKILALKFSLEAPKAGLQSAAARSICILPSVRSKQRGEREAHKKSTATFRWSSCSLLIRPKDQKWSRKLLIWSWVPECSYRDPSEHVVIGKVYQQDLKHTKVSVCARMWEFVLYIVYVFESVCMTSMCLQALMSVCSDMYCICACICVTFLTNGKAL